MHECIDFEELASGEKQRLKALALMRLASIVIASDGDDRCVLYDEPSPGGHLLSVLLHPGDVMLEQKNLRELCRIVTEVKGRCDFKIAEATPVETKFSTELEPTNRIKESLLREAFDDDDDERANWWKRGDV